jgi:hypothetical protein
LAVFLDLCHQYALNEFCRWLNIKLQQVFCECSTCRKVCNFVIKILEST